jgi:hypothetical protein
MSQLSLDVSERWVAHCMREPYDVYIGRGCCPQTGKQGEWGNRYSHDPKSKGTILVASRSIAIASYHDWLVDQPDLVAKARKELRGKVLGCWCAPMACHGAVLARIANS